MSEQEPVATEPTEEPAAEVAATEEKAPEPTVPQAEPAKPQTDWEAAYKGTQKWYERLQADQRDTRKRLDDLGGTLEYLKATNDTLLKSVVGEDQAKELDAQLKKSTADATRQRGAEAAFEFTKAQTNLFNEALSIAGVDPRTIRWPTDAGSVAEWYERARAEVVSAVSKSREPYIKAVEKAQAEASAKAKAEAKRLADATLKEAGVGKIDSSRGGTARSGLARLNDMSPDSKEFDELRKAALAGKLRSV